MGTPQLDRFIPGNARKSERRKMIDENGLRLPSVPT
jgi:hypothetical protein